MRIDTDDLRITKLRDYLVDVINEIANSSNNKINANALPKNINSYSLDKIPTEIEVETWVDGTEIHRDLFNLRSRMDYSYNDVNNLANIGFFELFEEKIRLNNKNGVLPDIDGIEQIRCMNCGTQEDANTGTAEFSIQVQIEYMIGG